MYHCNCNFNNFKEIHPKLADFIEKFINDKYPTKFNFSHNRQKFPLKLVINEVFYLLKSGVSYRDYRGPLKKSTLNFHIKWFSDNQIFQNVYKLLLTKYLKTNKSSKLKYQSIDTSFIANIHGHDKIGRNKFYKNKRGTKISSITDANGIPLSLLFDSGNISDTNFVVEHFNNMYVETNTKKYHNNNRYKQYFLADKGYDSEKVRDLLQENGYIPIIDYNKRNTKDETKIKKLTVNEKKKYKKRIVIENSFGRIKINKRIRLREDNQIKMYITFVFMSFIKMVFNKIAT